MFSKILVAIDGSDHAWKALEVACDLAKAHGGDLLVLHAVDRPVRSETLRLLAEVEHIPFEEEASRFSAELALGDALAREGASRARSAGVEGVSALIGEGSPAKQIVDIAEREHVDTVVVGSRGLGEIPSLLLGSVSHKVAHLAGCTCIVVK
jgi:nucleotide-binding universal stress UspA family protein